MGQRRIPPHWQWPIRGVIAAVICKVRVCFSAQFRATASAIWMRPDLSFQQKMERAHAEYLEKWNEVFYSDWLQQRVLGIRP